MASDDTGEWLTYAEAGKRLGISTAAAQQLSRRRKWPRRTPNAYGVLAEILVPTEALKKPMKPPTDGRRMGDIGRDTSEAAFGVLVRQLEREQGRADRAEQQLDAERQRVETGRRRIDELQGALADAVAAERIAAGEAARLRERADRRREWRLWRRLSWALRRR
jgi:hypothetical protein